MARGKSHHEEHENHERWLVSYADFITLLFAFFVVMYAVSSVNAGKYRVLSDTLESTFQANQRNPSIAPMGEPARALVPLPGEALPAGKSEKSSDDATVNELEDAAKESGNALKRIGDQTETRTNDAVAGEVNAKLAALANRKLIQVTRGDGWVDVEMKSNILFGSGSARLSPAAVPILTEVAAALGGFANPLEVQGYTDNQPINTPAYPSNWELSAARAASVVHLFSDLHIKPERMSAVGFGEYHAKTGNDTPEGRQQNRRVVIRISAGETPVPAPAGAGGGTPPAAAAPQAGQPALDRKLPENQAGGQPATPAPPAAAAPAIKSVIEFPGKEGPDR